MNNIISIWKPPGITSHDVVKLIKKRNNNCKVGHCGTLDPFAEGVLIVCIGDKVKDASKYMMLSKKYEADIMLGSETDTLDYTGRIIKSCNNDITITKTSIAKTLKTFIGKYMQCAPYFSAKKINGVKMYKLARKDIFIRRKRYPVIIKELKLVKYSKKTLSISLTCSSGTYVRSLAKDISESLGTYGHLIKLTRTEIGEFNYNNSTEYSKINA